MTDPHRRDRLVQDYLDGRIGETELRRRLGEPAAPAGPEDLERDLAAYRRLWEALGEKPGLELGEEFARRTARAALAEREARRAGSGLLGLVAGGAGLLVGVVVLVAAALLPAAGVPAGGLWREILAPLGEVHPVLWGSVGSAAVLYAVDALVLRDGMSTPNGFRPGRAA